MSREPDAVADYRGLAAVGRSLVDLMNRRFTELLPDPPRPAVVMVGGRDLDLVAASPESVIQYPSVSLFCYRLSVDRETRPAWSAVSSVDGVSRLPLRMHLLLMAWDRFAEAELEWLGLAVQVLEHEPLLTGPLLHPSGGWSPGECVQVIPDDLGLDSVSEAFQALTTKYRLCLPYLARVIRLEGPARPAAPRVAAVGRGELVAGAAP